MRDSLIILGVMSGTSLDGVDLALCAFSAGGKKYQILRAETFPYSPEWKTRLQAAERSAGAELIASDRAYGKYIGDLCHRFLGNAPVDYIASHGHTIFHEPARGITFQLGSGTEIAIAAGADTISDFRTADVALGGQGAPLVPVGDALLFSDYTYCLNLGGFINVSFDANGQRIAYDIAPMNYVLNRITQRIGKEYDENGALASSGKYISSLGEQLDALEYYRRTAPKSLGREWVELNVFPLMTDAYKAEDLLHTFCVHAARQVAASCTEHGKMLVTGGGAYNSFFIEELRKACKAEIILPDDQTIQFKEALIFALLGYLRVHGKNNALSSVTGASRDSCGGVLTKA